MTRIFDALRKAKATPSPESAWPAPGPVAVPVPAPTPILAATRAVRPMLTAAIAPPPTIPFVLDVPLSEEIAREMTALRVHLEVALSERTPRIVMFQSAQGGEGTTTIASQFATSLARDPRLRVLIVDTHARRPLLAVESLAAMQRPHPEGRHNLDVLPLAQAFRAHGSLPAAAARETVEAVAKHYDWVVLDGPPVLESPDAAPLSITADGVVLVVQAGRTKRPVLGRAVDLLRRAGGHVLGTVLNRRRLEIPEFIYRRI